MKALRAQDEIPALPASTSAVSLRCDFRKRLVGSGQDFSLDLAFESDPGFTILFGASGAGKTTLLDCIAGLVTPDEGSISVGNRTLFDSDRRINTAAVLRRVGYVFQTLALFPHMTVEANVRYGLHHLPSREAADRVARILESFRIAPLAGRSARDI